ncbi:MAG: CDP-diacylglycerol--serine O-phosphatidyltransferase [Planctomycetales bacterium]|nr:CDP-diacylglycerol--serine O-phosphatidyltransferase [Planctomycetales bacterium]
MKRIRTVAVLPTLFTLGNLVCGFFAIVVLSRIEAPTSTDVPTAARIEFRGSGSVMPALDTDDPTHNAMLCGWLIFLAMVFDALDGHVARLAKVSSDFGAQLDSLCDLVTFGVAPAILLVKICPSFVFLHREEVWIIATAFAACAALRLARFNVETGEDDDHFHFSGLPTPAAAASIAGFAIFFYTLRNDGNEWAYAGDIDRWLQGIVPFFAMLVALLMVSRVPYPHVVNQLFRGQKSFGHVVGLIFALVVVMLIRGYTVPLLCAVFVLGPPIRFFVHLARERRQRKEPLF